MDVELHPGLVAVCRLAPDSAIPTAIDLAARPLVAVTRTPSELSLVLPQASVPVGVQVVGGWRALSVRGPLPFHLTGILASLAGPLAEAGVPIFALSTYDTDWLLVAEDRLADARRALESAGNRVHTATPPT